MCVHSVRTLSHDASLRRVTQTLEQLLKALFSLSLSVSPTDSHQNEKAAPWLHLIYLDPLQQTWVRFLNFRVFAYGWNPDVMKDRQKKQKTVPEGNY